MIVVAVVAILAAIALPSYAEHLRRSVRAEAQGVLEAVAARQQQFLLDTRAYAPTLAATGVPVPANVASAYTLTLAVGTALPPGFTVTATPTGRQAEDRCGALGIDQAGRKTAARSGCW